MEELKAGLRGEVSSLVEPQDTAQEVGSGSLKVFATPCMVAMMEGAACEAIAPCLPEGQTSVGTRLDISHTSATPVGLAVYGRLSAQKKMALSALLVAGGLVVCTAYLVASTYNPFLYFRF